MKNMKTEEKINAVRAELNDRFPERAGVIDGALAAMLAGEHVLLLGPPGTAKSALVRALTLAFGGTYFEHLLTKFTTPEELFGPISLKALEQDRFARITTGRLSEVEVAFVDEVFKANSAILNSLLSLMNERVFHNDGFVVKCPLVSAFGASNELPDGKELEALFDRFLVRFDVGYLLRPANLRAVLTSPDPILRTTLDMPTLRAVQAEVAKVTVTDETIDALLAIREACKVEGIVASDRRWKKTIKLVQATAWLAEETQTTPEDLAVLIDCLWREPKERAKLAKIVGRLADPVGTQAVEILDAAREVADKATSLKGGDRKQHVAACAEALSQFTQQTQKLDGLARSAGRRARSVIGQATGEIRGMHAELARTISSGLGLGGLKRVQ